VSQRLLLDTHVFLWWRGEPDRLKEEARRAIGEAEVVFVSVASAWEAAIKMSIGRLRLPGDMESGVKDSGSEKLPITLSHAERVIRLPHHHRDPFDRMLVAQAITEDLTLVSHDRRLRVYEAQMLWA